MQRWVCRETTRAETGRFPFEIAKKEAETLATWGAGTAAYPVTVFTNLDLAAVCEALSCAVDGTGRMESGMLARLEEEGGTPSEAGAGLVLDVRGAGVRIPGGSWALRDLTFSLRAGELFLLEGPSGCGKTTFLHALRGLHPLAEGSVLLPPPNQASRTPPFLGSGLLPGFVADEGPCSGSECSIVCGHCRVPFHAVGMSASSHGLDVSASVQ